MAKSRFDKIESMLEEILNETNLDAKIEQMEKSKQKYDKIKQKEESTQKAITDATKDIENIKNDNNLSDEEKSKKITSLEEKIKKLQRGKGVKDLEKNILDEGESRKSIEEEQRKLQFYKAFSKNKTQIMNIREYQLALQNKLEELESKLGVVNDFEQSGKKLQKESQKIETEYQKLMKKRDEITKKLKNPALSNEDKQKLIDEDNKLKEKVEKNSSEYRDVQDLLKSRIGIEAGDKKQINNEIAETKTSISKCNMIWQSLLRGKDWNEIEVNLKKNKFKADKGTINKIRDLKIATNNQNQVENTIQEEEEKDKYNLGKKVDEELEFIGNNPEPEGQSIPEYMKDEKSLTNIEGFAKRHPILGKIPFLAKFMDGRAAKKMQRDLSEGRRQFNLEEDLKQEIPQKQEIPEQEMDHGSVEEEVSVDLMKKVKGKEEDIFKDIAEKGWKETIKISEAKRMDEKREKFKKMKEIAAKEYAEKYGKDKNGNIINSRYNHQDGIDR